MTPDHGFYRRPLPAPLVAFASTEGRTLFREAMAEGNLEGWFPLAEQFHTQADPAFCGLGTLVVALNALGVDPGRLWKGPWRWYSEELLDCCVSLDDVRRRGITLDQFACLARCNGATAEMRRADVSSLEAFRADLHTATSTPDGPVLAVAYSRGALGQTGDGHFSPVAALHRGRDLALVLDVARFKYPPHWVPVPLLYEAMRAHDPANGKSRGWVLLRRREMSASLLFRVANGQSPWSEVARRLLVDTPSALSCATPRDLHASVHAFASALSPEMASSLRVGEDALEALAPEHRAMAVTLLEAIRATKLHADVTRELASEAGTISGASELVTMLLLASSGDALDEATASPVLRAEVEVLREQMRALRDAYGAMGVSAPCPACGP